MMESYITIPLSNKLNKYLIRYIYEYYGIFEYVDITENMIETLSKINSNFYQYILDEYLDRENVCDLGEVKPIHLIFSPDFSDHKYEIYFQMTNNPNHKIELKEIDSLLKINYMDQIYNGIINLLINYARFHGDSKCQFHKSRSNMVIESEFFKYKMIKLMVERI